MPTIPSTSGHAGWLMGCHMAGGTVERTGLAVPMHSSTIHKWPSLYKHCGGGGRGVGALNILYLFTYWTMNVLYIRTQ
jgi:hypothetical protein